LAYPACLIVTIIIVAVVLEANTTVTSLHAEFPLNRILVKLLNPLVVFFLVFPGGTASVAWKR
jgi:hypothetical protein